MSKTIQGWMTARTAVALAALLTLAACGGGGGGSAPAAPSSVTVAGVASKGLLANAIVSAYSVTSGGAKGALIKSATTDAQGNYTLSGLTPGALVLLEVTPNPDGSTTMRDEATGQAVPLPVSSGFTLRAATSLDTSGTTSAQITPYSEMAVTLAAAAPGGIKADVVAAANNKISAFAGISILADKPTFDSSGKATNAAAVKLAAVSELAKAGVADGGTTCGAPDPAQAAQVLAAVSCVVDYLASAGTSSTVTSALNTALDTAKTKAVISDPIELAKVTAPVSEQPPELTVVPTAAQTAIQEAKTLIQSVRDTGAAMSSKTTSGTLANRLQLIAEGAKGVPSPLDDATLRLLSAVSEAIDKSTTATTSFPLSTLYRPSASDLTWYTGGNTTVAASIAAALNSGCSFKTDATFQTDSSVVTDYVGCKILQRVIYGPVTIGMSSTYAPQAAVLNKIRLTKGGADSYTISTALYKVAVTPTGVGAQTTLGGVTLAASDFHPMTATRTGTAPNYTGFTLVGDMAPGVEAKWGAWSPSAVWPEMVQLGAKQTVNLSLAAAPLSGDTATTRLSMNGDISVTDGAQTLSRLSVKTGSYIQAKTTTAGDLNTISDVDVSTDQIHLILEGQIKSGFTIHGELDLNTFVNTATRWGPTKGSFTGWFTDMGASTHLFDGSITLTMPTDTGLGWVAGFNGDLVTTGTNTLNVKLTLTASSSVDGDFMAAGVYTQGGTSFTVTVVHSDLTPTNDSLSFSTLSGVGFNYKDGDSEVSIKKGDTVVGSFNVGSSRLTYADNTYQQF